MTINLTCFCDFVMKTACTAVARWDVNCDKPEFLFSDILERNQFFLMFVYITFCAIWFIYVSMLYFTNLQHCSRVQQKNKPSVFLFFFPGDDSSPKQHRTGDAARVNTHSAAASGLITTFSKSSILIIKKLNLKTKTKTSTNWKKKKKKISRWFLSFWKMS